MDSLGSPNYKKPKQKTENNLELRFEDEYKNFIGNENNTRTNDISIADPNNILGHEDTVSSLEEFNKIFNNIRKKNRPTNVSNSNYVIEIDVADKLNNLETNGNAFDIWQSSALEPSPKRNKISHETHNMELPDHDFENIENKFDTWQSIYETFIDKNKLSETLVEESYKENVKYELPLVKYNDTNYLRSEFEITLVASDETFQFENTEIQPREYKGHDIERKYNKTITNCIKNNGASLLNNEINSRVFINEDRMTNKNSKTKDTINFTNDNNTKLNILNRNNINNTVRAKIPSKYDGKSMNKAKFNNNSNILKAYKLSRNKDFVKVETIVISSDDEYCEEITECTNNSTIKPDGYEKLIETEVYKNDGNETVHDISDLMNSNGSEKPTNIEFEDNGCNEKAKSVLKISIEFDKRNIGTEEKADYDVTSIKYENTIEAESDNDSYNSSDFKFIDETEAADDTFNLRDFFENLNDLKLKEFCDENALIYDYFKNVDPIPNIDEFDTSYRDNHRIPQDGDYLNLFGDNYIPYPMCRFENKATCSGTGMDAGYEIGFDMRSVIDDSTLEQRLAAKECEQKILSMYPTDNRRRRHTRL